MIGEVIAIGDELSSGERLDTNSQWLARQLTDLGIRVMYHTTVADEMTANQAVFQVAAARADVVVISGGLGPTADDLTREAVASAFGLPVERRAEILEWIQQLFRSRGREMPERNAVQADFPAGSIVVPNPHGSAPGFWLQIPRRGRRDCAIAALPGVPAEMREMWDQTVAGHIASLLGTERRVIRHKTLHCFGAGESDIERRLPDLIRRGREPSVGITASQATITLRITATAADLDSCEQEIAPVVKTIRESLRDLVYGEDGIELHQVVIQLLRQHQQSLAIDDRGSGGRILEMLRDADPLGTTFVAGVVGSGSGSLFESSPTSETSGYPTQPQAEACRLQFGTTWGLALQRVWDTDQALADDAAIANEGALIEYLEITLTNGQTRHTRRFRFAAHPDILLPRAAKQGLDLVRLTLKSMAELPS